MSVATDVLPATLAHAHALAATMRVADEAEVRAAGHSPYDAVIRSMNLSGGECWTLMIDNQVAAVGGVMMYGILQRAGIPWLLTSTVVSKYPKVFWRAVRAKMYDLRRQYGFLTNVVDSRYTSSLRWLERLGFESRDEVEINGHPFTRVVMRSETWG
jgi:hypothetical protein